MTDAFPSLRDAGLIVGVSLLGYLLLIALGQLLRRARGLRFGWTFHAFAALAGLLVGLHLSGWRSPAAVAALQHFTAAILLFAAFPLVTICNRIFWVRKGTGAGLGSRATIKDVPRVLTDVTGILIVLTAVLIALQFVYDVEVPGLLAGSGVIAIIVGLAMQDLLGNLIAGIGLHFDKSFTAGDWLLIEGTHAKVIELSWRSTRLITIDDVMIDVPNSNIVKQAILNFEKPFPTHTIKPVIGLHYDIPPAQAQRVLEEAAASVPGVCTHPAPVAHIKEFADSAIVYEINVSISDHAKMEQVMSDVYVHCWYATKRAGFEIPYPQMTLHRPAPARTDPTLARTARQALRTHAVFCVLSEEQIETLLSSGEIQLFATTEAIITQGEHDAAMYFILRGEVEVWVEREGVRKSMAVLGPGDCVGEMSLLTGEPRSATVTARSEVTVIEITKSDFAVLVEAQPDLLSRVSEVLAQRALALKKLASGTAPAGGMEATRGTMLNKLRTFFQLGG